MIDGQRPTKGRNTDWRHPDDPDAHITIMKDGRTHLAHKADHEPSEGVFGHNT